MRNEPENPFRPLPAPFDRILGAIKPRDTVMVALGWFLGTIPFLELPKAIWSVLFSGVLAALSIIAWKLEKRHEQR